MANQLDWTRLPDSSWAVYVHHDHPTRAMARRLSNIDAYRSLFTVVRPARGANGVVAAGAGWVVGGRGFETATLVPTLDDAKLRVEAMFALEYDSLV
jgi:hypothetical protein